MPLQATSGAASYDAFGGGVPVVPAYIEEVFSTYLYAGNNSTQTITNGIDLSGKGGLVWTKARVDRYHNLEDTVRGAGNSLWSNASSANYYYSDAITSFGSTGYTLGADGTGNQVNSSANYVSWTFRKQPKFFDVQQVTLGTSTNRQVAHNLASVPGLIIGKKTNGSGNWVVYHRSLGINKWLALQTTDAETSRTGTWGTSNPTATDFYFDETYFGSSGDTYIFYLFAHDAGGFGLTGTDNVISCGSYTSDASGQATINLGYEPQYLLVKSASTTGNWNVIDNMRGWTSSGGYNVLYPNGSAAEVNVLSDTFFPLNATGFQQNVNVGGWTNQTFIYIAIRRGPMKVPTSGTSVFTPVQNSNFTAGVVIAGQPTVDMVFNRQKDGSNYTRLFDRLRGSSGSTNPVLYTNTDDAETNTALWALDQQNGVRITQTVGTYNYVNYLFSRAPQFFDEVCYTGTGSSATSFSHNLGVAPELIISKVRSAAGSNWIVTSNFTSTNYLLTALNLTIAGDTFLYTADASIAARPTSTTLKFTGGIPAVNESGSTYVAYLFATCAGVSKVGNYTGTGTTKQIDCGFTGGARFVLIKRTDSTGDWYYWDSSRGIVAGNDPYLLINSMAAEVTNTDYVDTYSAGFEISSTAPAAINASGGTYIFLAIA